MTSTSAGSTSSDHCDGHSDRCVLDAVLGERPLQRS